MNVKSYDYSLRANGTLQDYLFAIHQFANASLYWQIDTVLTSGGAADETNITQITVELKSDPTKKVRFEPRTSLFNRDTIAMWFSDGGGVDYGFWPGEKFSHICYIDNLVNSTVSTQTKAFNNATYGAQNVTGSKGVTFVETHDMLSMFVYGRGERSSNWQFGVMAGRIVEWLTEGVEPWGLIAGNTTIGGPSSTGTINNGPMIPTFNRSAQHNQNNVSKSAQLRAGNNWCSLCTPVGPISNTNFASKLGDPLGTQYESLSPVAVAACPTKGNSNVSSGLGFMPYIRHWSAAAPTLDTIYDSNFSSSISWRAQRPNAPEALVADNIVWIWDQAAGGAEASTAL